MNRKGLHLRLMNYLSNPSPPIITPTFGNTVIFSDAPKIQFFGHINTRPELFDLSCSNVQKGKSGLYLQPVVLRMTKETERTGRTAAGYRIQFCNQ